MFFFFLLCSFGVLVFDHDDDHLCCLLCCGFCFVLFWVLWHQIINKENFSLYQPTNHTYHHSRSYQSNSSINQSNSTNEFTKTRSNQSSHSATTTQPSRNKRNCQANKKTKKKKKKTKPTKKGLSEIIGWNNELCEPMKLIFCETLACFLPIVLMGHPKLAKCVFHRLLLKQNEQHERIWNIQTIINIFLIRLLATWSSCYNTSQTHHKHSFSPEWSWDQKYVMQSAIITWASILDMCKETIE